MSSQTIYSNYPREKVDQRIKKYQTCGILNRTAKKKITRKYLVFALLGKGIVILGVRWRTA